MAEPKTVYCPQCGRRVGQWDGRSTINVVTHCRNCKKRVIYHIDKDVTEVKAIPPRNSSSGMILY